MEFYFIESIAPRRNSFPWPHIACHDHKSPKFAFPDFSKVRAQTMGEENCNAQLGQS